MKIANVPEPAGSLSVAQIYSLYQILATLVDRLDSDAMIGTGVMDWGCPVPSFGDPSHSRVATLGINPSNREFVNDQGQELEGVERRFHTLQSLRLESWSRAGSGHLGMVLDACCSYFRQNPYAGWFNRLEFVLSGLNVSYYDDAGTACHFDLIPYATERKWSELQGRQRASLLNVAQDTLALILRDTPVRTLILNGSSVVKRFQYLAGVNLKSEPIPGWSLKRKGGRDVLGTSYKGTIDTLAGVGLERSVTVVGFNHNLQSSFGINREVIRSIRDWIAQNGGRGR